MLPPQHNYEPSVKPPSWNEAYFCDYHRCRGHRTNNCQALKHAIQDLIDKGIIIVEGQQKSNEDHHAFRNPLPNYQKGEFSDKNVNQIDDNVIHHLYTNDERVNVIKIKEKVDNGQVNVTTRAQAKVVLKGTSSKSTETFPQHQYDLVNQLQKTPAQISILELLKISPTHKEILDKALFQMTVSTDLDVNRFQAMVGHFSSPTCLSFLDKDDVSMTHPHNSSLYLEVMIHKFHVKRVLIDGGAGLNICTLKVVQALGFVEDSIDLRRKITIKSYDDEERTSKGLIMLPIRVGPVIKNTFCQVLDRDLAYNILLGRPWIHEMQVVPSTYHQCLKFPYDGQEITIPADNSNTQTCANVKAH